MSNRSKPQSAQLFLPILITGLCFVHSNFKVTTGQESSIETNLKNIGINTEPEALKKYLAVLSPLNTSNPKIAKLIQQLGDDDYHVRQATMLKLMTTPLPIEIRLQQAAQKSTDAEIRRRAQVILKNRKKSNHLISVLKVVSQKQLQNTLPELFALIPQCDSSEKRFAIEEAILSCASTTNTTFLKQKLSDENPVARICAARAIEKLKTKGVNAVLDALGKDDSDQVKVVAARLMIKQGNRNGLLLLSHLLQSDDLLVRVLAASTLRQATNHNFGFVGYLDQTKQNTSIQKWKDWVKKNGRSAKLETSLKREVAKGRDLAGHTLLAYGNTNDKVVEFDLDGQEVWHYQAKSPRAAEKLANGNVLISELKNNRIIEVNMKGDIVWQAKVDVPLTVYPLTNGNILVAQFSNPSQAVEINRLGEVVWRMPVAGNCCSAYPVGNDKTLIAAYGDSVFEVARSGKRLWSFSEKQSHGSRQLSNGNILVSVQPTGRVLEVNRDRKVVWECRHHGAVDAFRLKNGNTLVSGYSQTVEVTPEKKIIWVHGGCQYGTARR